MHLGCRIVTDAADAVCVCVCVCVGDVPVRCCVSVGTAPFLLLTPSFVALIRSLSLNIFDFFLSFTVSFVAHARTPLPSSAMNDRDDGAGHDGVSGLVSYACWDREELRRERDRTRGQRSLLSWHFQCPLLFTLLLSLTHRLSFFSCLPFLSLPPLSLLLSLCLSSPLASRLRAPNSTATAGVVVVTAAV